MFLRPRVLEVIVEIALRTALERWVFAFNLTSQIK
jgi:hypothetical protein